MIKRLEVGDIVKVKSQYHEMSDGSGNDVVGIVTAVTRSCDHEFESIRRLEEQTGKKIDIISVMVNGSISDWFDDELEIVS